MNNPTTYTLLVGSEEKGRDLLETVAYAICILSVIVAIWQFVEQPTRLFVDGLTLGVHPAGVISQHGLKANSDAKS
jgi:hypothetical protein